MLRIDLLPEHFAAARAAKLWIVVMALALVAGVVGCMGWLMMLKGTQSDLQAELQSWEPKANEVRALEDQKRKVDAEAAPIDGKVSFIEEADGCGEQFWNAWDKVNRYVYAKARVLSVTVQPPSSISFDVELPDTTAVGRFILNLIRCPDISDVRINGAIPSGPGIGPGGGAGGAMGGPGMGEGGMGGGMMGGGMPGMGPMGGPMMGPGMGMGGMGGGGGGATTLGGTINLSVSATLGEALTVPDPTAAPAAGAPGGAPGAGGAMPGMGGGAMAPGMGGGAMGPSMAPGMGGGASGGAPAGGGFAGGGED